MNKGGFLLRETKRNQIGKRQNAQKGTRVLPGQRVVPECDQFAPVLSKIGDKWVILEIVLLGDRPKRFNQLKRKIHTITQRMLTRTLRILERDGIVKRTVLPTLPSQVEYDLTALGHSLSKPMKQLSDWIADNLELIEHAQSRFDKLHKKPRAICATTRNCCQL